MGDFTAYKLTLFEKDLKLIRSALISKETEERSLMRSYEGTNEYYEHWEKEKHCEILRDKIERIK